MRSDFVTCGVNFEVYNFRFSYFKLNDPQQNNLLVSYF